MAATAFAVAVGTVAVAASLGTRISGYGLFDAPAFAGASGGYPHVHGEVFPLRAAYVDRVLGSPAATDVPVAPTQTDGVGVLPHADVITHAFTNDDFGHAIDIAAVPYAASTNTRGATREAREPASCAPVGSTVWYRFEAPAEMNLFTDTFGTSYPVAVSVLTGDDLASLRDVGCDKNATGNAQLGFRARTGRTYWFQVTGPVGGGTLVFHLFPAGLTERTSVSSTGERPNELVSTGDPPAMSADGRFIVFYSWATNLGGCPRGPCSGLFLRDRLHGVTTPVASLPRNENEPLAGGSYASDADLWNPDVSDDGRYVVFHTSATTFAPHDENGDYDVILFDAVTRRYERVSVASDGHEGHAPSVEAERAPVATQEDNFPGSKYASVSADGRYVVFTSDAPDLVTGDTNGSDDVFLRDRATGRTELLSIGPSGAQLGRAETRWGENISADGRFVTFTAWSTAPVATGVRANPSTTAQVYVRDRVVGRTTMLSVARSGAPGDLDSYWPAISRDGRRVAFTSESDDLVAGDTNGRTCTHAGADTCGSDVFVTSSTGGRVARASVSSSGAEQVIGTDQGGNATANGPPDGAAVSISADGRYVAFASYATNLVPGDDTNTAYDVFVHDMDTGATVLASISSTGDRGNDNSVAPVLSGDGSIVGFDSEATNLVGDGHGGTFVHQWR